MSKSLRRSAADSDQNNGQIHLWSSHLILILAYFSWGTPEFQDAICLSFRSYSAIHWRKKGRTNTWHFWGEKHRLVALFICLLSSNWIMQKYLNSLLLTLMDLASGLDCWFQRWRTSWPHFPIVLNYTTPGWSKLNHKHWIQRLLKLLQHIFWYKRWQKWLPAHMFINLQVSASPNRGAPLF